MKAEGWDRGSRKDVSIIGWVDAFGAILI